MSENLNRSTPDFSKYDSMSIGELEEILRADAQGPGRDDSDVDEILYVMEVLAKKRRQNGIAGKTALEAYQEFQQHYLAKAEEEDIESAPTRKANVIPFKRIAAVAASLVLVFSLSTTANAFSFKDVWNAMVTWAQETFSFSMGVEVSEPTPQELAEYESLQEVLSQNNRDEISIPVIFPEGFFLEDIIIDENPLQEIYLAIYNNGERRFKISVKSFRNSRPEEIEVSGNLIEKYSSAGIEYYIMQNNDILQAVWISDTFECYIAGDLSINEIKMMIDSIEKG